MGKLAKMGARPAKRSPIKTTGPALTFEGGVGAARDAKSELFVLAASNLVSENTFYEGGTERDHRYRALIHAVAAEDPAWIAGLARYLRAELNMRSASIVMAAEYVSAGAPNGRKVIASVLLRPDEPGALLGYWFGTYGRAIPAAIKRGITDTLPRLYTERNTIKYDGKGQTFRFGDVIELVHPKPSNDHASILYKHLVDRTHDHVVAIPEDLQMLTLDTIAWGMSPEGRAEIAADPRNAELWIRDAGMTWERYASWVGRPLNAMDWAALVPNMGLMAIVRNLRNMDTTGISNQTIADISVKLHDPDEVRRSRQLPFRFYTAWREVRSLQWGLGLEAALNLSLENVPSLDGRSLIMVDHSGSMSFGTISERSSVHPRELADVFGAALAVRAESADLFVYDQQAMQVAVGTGDSLLRTIERMPEMGGGTQTLLLLEQLYRPEYDRVIIVTDEQVHPSGARLDAIKVPIYTFNIGGYRVAHMEATGNRHTFAGLSDSSFTILKTLEAGRDGHWPWEEKH
jgi:hypothetical protein